MNPSAPPVSSRRRYWPWVLAFCLAPIVILGAAAVSFLTLDRDAAALRGLVMGSTKSEWHTKAQVSAGRLTLGAVRTGLAFVANKELADARVALDSVSRVSVGVYGREPRERDASSRQELGAATDRAMNRRGWSRLVGVLDHQQTVLVYVPTKVTGQGSVDLCLAVLGARDLVVVATTVRADGLAGLVERHAGEACRRKLTRMKF